MTKKISSVFSASIVKNQSKGGAWLTTIKLTDEGIEAPYDSYQAAWANASAAKRWIKEVLQATTNRKSIKMIVNDLRDEKQKPVLIEGSTSYKREA